jgi:protein phosphatase
MSDASAPKTGGLWARLFGLKETEEPEATGPAAQAPPAAEAPAPPPPVATNEELAAAAPPSPDAAEAEAPLSVVEPDAPEAAAPAELAEPVAEEQATAPAETAPAVEALPDCPACGTRRKPKQRYCEDCGWLFAAESTTVVAVARAAAPAVEADAVAAPSPDLSPRGNHMPTSIQARLRDRYELRQLVGERQGTKRYRGFDHSSGEAVVIVVTPLAPPDADVDEVAPIVEPDEILPGFDEDVPVAALISNGSEVAGAGWPSAGWEKQLLTRASHPSLPRVVDSFTDNGSEYLVEHYPIGSSLWDAWDEADDAATRYGWARQIAEALHTMHQAGAILEGVRPDLVVISDSGQAVLADLADLLPLPLPASPPLRASLYTAPELILAPQSADARADLYSFGAMLYSLEYLHHTLEEKDFERQFVPRQITDRYPDVHPLLLRVLNKTFVRDANTRFPTDEAGRTDASGFTELIRTLEICRRVFDQVRFDVAAWTTTGMVRTGNEDAFCALHAVEQRQDDLSEYALLLLCDGMGGYEAGEVAAALALAKMREFLLQQPMFAALAGKEPPANPPDPKALQEVLTAALRHANREVYTASRTPGKGRRGMGCTAECVYIDTKNIVVAHVGDSRTYHLRRGRLLQLTRDQTFVNRMVELGQLTAAEAENHPRKNELQQAIGGQPDVVPGAAASKLTRGDWVLVCSDGLTNHVNSAELEKMLTRETAYSAEEAARRLLNLTNLRGATDNATIVVVRTS